MFFGGGLGQPRDRPFPLFVGLVISALVDVFGGDGAGGGGEEEVLHQSPPVGQMVGQRSA